MPRKVKWFHSNVKEKDFLDEVKIKLNGKTYYPTTNMLYLGVKIDENLSWQHHVNNFLAKLNKANILLLKIRKFVNDKVPRSIHFAIFKSN